MVTPNLLRLFQMRQRSFGVSRCRGGVALFASCGEEAAADYSLCSRHQRLQVRQQPGDRSRRVICQQAGPIVYPLPNNSTTNLAAVASHLRISGRR
jgi:hypothetical protein